MSLRILLSFEGNGENYINAMESLGCEAVKAVGGEKAENFDGLLLCGGADLDPALYNEGMNGTKKIDRERDALEMALTEEFVRAGKPIFGICRGCQLLNVYFGGSLIQHLPASDIHDYTIYEDLVHPIAVEEGSILSKLYGERFMINSNHHQAVKQPGKGIRITGYLEDVPEAIEHESLPIFAVQWHPERMSFEKRREDTVDGEAVLKYFVELCAKYAKQTDERR